MHNKKFNYIKSFLSVSFFTILSRVTGYCRELLFANFIGINNISDAITLAIKLPSFFRRIFGEGAFHSSFIPIFISIIKQDSEESKKEAFIFAGQILSILIFFSTLMVLVIEYNIISINKFVFSDLFYKQQETFKLYIELCKITTPYIIVISIASFFGSILNAFGKFGIYAASQIIGNLILIIGIIIFRKSSFIGFCAALLVLFSGVVQFGWVLFSFYMDGFRIKLLIPRLSTNIKKFFKNISSGILSVAVIQTNVVLASFFASSLGKGSISYMNYADRFNQLPLSIIGISLSSILLPVLSIHIKNNDILSAYKIKNQSFKIAIILTLPIALFISVSAYYIIIAFFGYGRMQQHDIEIISQILRIFAFGIPACIFMKIFNVQFFAIGNTTTPLHAALISLFIDLTLNLLLKDMFQCNGIAFASIISIWANIIFLFYQIIKQKLWYINNSIKKFCKKVFILSILLSIGLFIVINLIQIVFNKLSIYSNTSYKLIFIIFTSILYFVSFIFLSIYYKIISKKQIKIILRAIKK